MENIWIDNLVSVLELSDNSTVIEEDCCTLTAVTSPGCWGPMITPSVIGGHEVTEPLIFRQAEVGDAILIKIKSIDVLSEAAASGTGVPCEGMFERDPSVAAKCPYCQVYHPDTIVGEIGSGAVHCAECGQSITPQQFEHGYTVVLDSRNRIGVTVPQQAADEIARKTLNGDMYLPEKSKQHLATILAGADMQNLIIRGKPMIGNIGCCPAKRMPSSKNSGDLVHTIGNTEFFEAVKPDESTDAHMDINCIGEGTTLLSPVLLPGGGFYLGDVHWTQGDGEIAGHTLDVSAKVVLELRLIKNMKIPGPIFIPDKNDLDPRFLPFSKEEQAEAARLASQYGFALNDTNYPVCFVGTGKGIDQGLENALQRIVDVTGLSPGEVKNRATVGGGVRVGRTSGSVYVTVSLSKTTLQETGLTVLLT